MRAPTAPAFPVVLPVRAGVRFLKGAVLGCMLAHLLSAFAGASDALLAATDKPDPQLTIELGGLPNFVFADERICLSLGISAVRERPAQNGRHAAETRKAQVHLTGPAPFQARTRDVLVPPYNDRSAQAPFLIGGQEVAHDSILTVEAAFADSPTGRTEIRALRPERAPPDIRLMFDHFEDAAGRRILFLVPRVSASARRRWYPIKATLQGRSDRDAALLVGSRYGSGDYARSLQKLWGPERFLPPALIGADKALPVYQLLEAAIQKRTAEAETVFVFPGAEDVRRGTPLEDYRMALHAALAVFDRRLGPLSRLVLATPPPYPSDPGRAAAYHDAALAVARERCWIAADLGALLGTAATGPATANLLPRYPGPAEHERIARCLVRAAMPGLGGWVALLAPCVVFLLVSGALLWLRVRIRYKRPKQRAVREPVNRSA